MPSRLGRILIISEKDDLHALLVQKYINDYYDVECVLFEANQLAIHTNVTWKRDSLQPSASGRIRLTNGHLYDLSDFATIWFRRCSTPQQYTERKIDNNVAALVNNSCHSTIVGTLLNSFSGRWVSHPTSSYSAENKITQLEAAIEAGIEIPTTLVSNDPEEIADFYTSLNNKVIIKPIRPSANKILLTQHLTDEHIANRSSVQLCPAIYQEFIPGSLHLRVHVFGTDVHCFSLKTDKLDWRIDYTLPWVHHKLDQTTEASLIRVLDILDLKMGIFDLKYNGSRIVWIEVNPQGQFLFIEGTTGAPLARAMANLLVGN